MAVSTQKYPSRMPANERREQILDVTLEVLAEQGFEALSIDAVARAAEITRPTVYGFFADLRALLNALVDREEQRALTQVTEAIPVIAAESDPDEVLVEAVRAFLAAVHRHPLTWRMILLPSEGLPREVRHRINARREELIGQLDHLVAWGIERRGGPRGVDTNLLARMIVGFAQDAARISLSDPDQFSVERLTQFAGALVKTITRDDPGSAGDPPPLDLAGGSGAE